MKKKIRLDVYLFIKGFSESRQKAQRMILAGKVKDIHGKVLDKPGQEILIDSQINISAEPKFVSRGGEKLLEAFKRFPLNVTNRVCIDAGISTGGFTDCLLQNGAQRIYGVDVGYGQTSWKLRNNPKVKLLERTNIRYLKSSSIFDGERLLPDFAVADLSFISLKLVLKPIKELLKKDYFEGVFLIKPQFEVGKEFISRGGVVRESKHHVFALESVIEASQNLNWKINGLVPSPLIGPAGNHEYLIWMSSKQLKEFKLNKTFITNLVDKTLN